MSLIKVQVECVWPCRSERCRKAGFGRILEAFTKSQDSQEWKSVSTLNKTNDFLSNNKSWFSPLPPLKHLTPRQLPSLPSTAYHGDGGIYHPWNSSLPGCLKWEQRECWHTSIKPFHGHGWIRSRPTLCFVRYIKRIKELAYKTTLPKVREKAVILEIVLILDCPFTPWYCCKAVDLLLDVVRVYVYDCLDRLLLMSEEE